MKVLIIDTECSGELIGGAQTFLVGLVHGLVNRGHDVSLVTRGIPNEKIRFGISNAGVPIYHNLWEDHVLVDDTTPILAKWVSENKPDVFVVSTSADIGWTILPLLEVVIANVAISHSDSDTYYGPLKYYSEFINRGIGVSNEICHRFQTFCNLSPKKTAWIPYGVTPRNDEPTNDFQTDTVPLQLIYVGRLAEVHKRVSDLYKIVAALNECNIDYSFSIIGDGPMMPVLKEQLTREIRENKVRLLGWLTNDELLKHLRKSDVSLLVSDTEGFPIALVEAMANGCAPVVTDIRSGNKQLVSDGVNGFVVPVGDIEAFADKIEVLASDREKLLEFRRRAWETGRQYSVQRMVEAYERCFEEAIQDARANPRRPDPDFPLMASCRSKYPLWLRRLKAKILSRK